jgi:hypothetical protein
MLRTLPYISVFLLACLTLFYLHDYQPQLWNTLLVNVDVFDLTPEARYEHARISAINRLPIHYEEKQVLINHTVFLGATEEMVRLALGEPKKTYPPAVLKNEQGEDVIVMYDVYYLQGSLRPTRMEFQEDKEDKLFKLVDAKKGSALQWGD